MNKDKLTENMRWVKCIDRLPVIPNPIPKNTPEERGVLFVNRTHSCGNFWYPSYNQPPQGNMNLQFDGWKLEQWEWLEELPSLPKETDAVEWVSVEDGLPEESQDVLISYKTIDGKRYIYTGFYFLGIWHFAEQGEEIGFQRKVTHWMPLPAPPKP